MVNVKNTQYYNDAIHVMTYPSGTYYLFETFVIAEIKEGIVFTWEDHAKQIVEELTHLYDQNGENIVYISNRVHSYSTRPSDWIKFYRSDFKLKAYGIVSYSKKSLMAAVMEKIFMRNRFQSFTSLDEAIVWAKSLTKKIPVEF